MSRVPIATKKWTPRGGGLYVRWSEITMGGEQDLTKLFFYKKFLNEEAIISPIFIRWSAQYSKDYFLWIHLMSVTQKGTDYFSHPDGFIYFGGVLFLNGQNGQVLLLER